MISTDTIGQPHQLDPRIIYSVIIKLSSLVLMSDTCQA